MSKLTLTSKSLHYMLLSIIGLLVIGLIGGTYLANTILTKQSGKLLDARTQSQALNQQSEQLAHTKADIEKYRSLSTIARGIVPQDKDQASTVREISRMAGDTGVVLSSITFPVSTLGGPAVATGKAAPVSTPSSSLSKAATSQLTADPSLKGVFTMPITVSFTDTEHPVPYANFINFLSALEKNRRTALVSSINLLPSQNHPGQVTFSLTVNEYVKP